MRIPKRVLDLLRQVAEESIKGGDLKCSRIACPRFKRGRMCDSPTDQECIDAVTNYLAQAYKHAAGTR